MGLGREYPQKKMFEQKIMSRNYSRNLPRYRYDTCIFQRVAKKHPLQENP